MEGSSAAVVDSFIAVTGLPTSNAAQWLKAHNNDVNSAVNAWMDGGMASLPPPSAPQYIEPYSESQFAADRAGDAAPNSQIEASFGRRTWNQPYDPSLFAGSVPPTRPSSRVGMNRNAQQGPENDPNIPPRQGSYENQLQWATEMSLKDRQFPGQQSGVTQSHFGPATQSHYDQDKWAVAIPEAHTQEIILSPDPLHRKRRPGFPVFLRPSTNVANKLPALIKVLHEIPLAREALLNREHVLDDYGKDSEWWDGHQIKALRVISTSEPSDATPAEEALHEAQRLMAFLDQTERAYGSGEVLSNQVSPGNAYRQCDDVVADFFKIWSEARLRQSSSQDAPLAKIFDSIGVRRYVDREPSTGDREHFYNFQVRVDSEVASKGFSLYQAIDELLWVPGDNNEVFLQEIGEIFCMDVENTWTPLQGLGVTVPAVWYVDRYLEDAVPKVKEMLAQKAAILKQAGQLDRIRDMLTAQKSGDGPTALDAAALVTKVMEYFGATAAFKDAELDASLKAGTASSNEETKQIMEALRSLMETISHKVKDLADIKESVAARIQKASELYTQPAEDPNEPPKRRYTLRGVVPNASSFYVLERVSEDNSLDLISSGSTMSDQWWRIEYAANTAAPVNLEKMTEAEVLEAASRNSSIALLVYASDKAIAYQSEAAPPQLRNFIQADNQLFQAELNPAITEVENPRVNDPIDTNVEAASEREEVNVTFSPQQKRKASNYDSDVEMESRRDSPIRQVRENRTDSSSSAQNATRKLSTTAAAPAPARNASLDKDLPATPGEADEIILTARSQ